MNEDYFWLKETEKLWWKATFFFGFLTVGVLFLCLFLNLLWWLSILMLITTISAGYYTGYRHKKAKAEAEEFLVWDYPAWFVREIRDSGIYNYKTTKFNPEKEIKNLYYKYTDLTDVIYYLPLYTNTTVLNNLNHANDFYDRVREKLTGINFPPQPKLLTYHTGECEASISTNNVTVTVISSTPSFALSMAILKVLLHEKEYHKLDRIYDLRNLPDVERDEPEEEEVDEESVEQLLANIRYQLGRMN